MTELAYDPDIDLSEYLEGIRDALAAFVDSARRAGLDAEVPTCPELDGAPADRAHRDDPPLGHGTAAGRA